MATWTGTYQAISQSNLLKDWTQASIYNFYYAQESMTWSPISNYSYWGSTSASDITWADLDDLTYDYNHYSFHCTINDIHFVRNSNSLFYLVSDSGTIYKSTQDHPDEQGDWSFVVSGTVENLIRIADDNSGESGTVIIVGANGIIIRSNNEGAFATVGAAVTSADILCIAHVSGNIWIAGTADGEILRSTDDGVNWGTINITNCGIGTENINGIASNGDTNIIACTDGGHIIKSIDSGASFFLDGSVGKNCSDIAWGNNTWAIVTSDVFLYTKTEL